jgi:small subunit ribosomal protein S12
MVTSNQLSKHKRIKKLKKTRMTGLDKCPQKKGVCISVTTKAPKKPSSGKRKIC